MKISKIYEQLFIHIFLIVSLFIPQFVQGGEYIISGKVIDAEMGKPVPGVNIFIENSEIGCVTDINGFFQIKTSVEKNEVLIVSHIKYEKQRIELKPGQDNTDFVIRLFPDIIAAKASIIVTATRCAKRKLDIPQASEIVNREEIIENMSSNITDLLDKTPGFNQVWEYHSPLLLRGMSSKHMIVLKNGNRRIGTFPGGFMGQALNIYDIERIEVIRGPGSVMYGTGAIAGIINIISPDPFKCSGLKARIEGGYGSNNNELIGLSELSWGSEFLGLNISGKIRKADDYVYGDGTTAENSMMEDKDISAHIGWKPIKNHTLILHTDYHNGGPWGKPIGFNKNYNLRVDNEEYNSSSSVKYVIKKLSVFEKFVISGYYDYLRRDYHKRPLNVITHEPASLETVHYKHKYGGGQVYASVKPLKKQLLTFGADGYAARLWSPGEKEDYVNNTFSSEKGVDNAGITSIGIFLQDDWIIMSNFLSLVTGIRYDIADVDEGDNPLNGKSGMKEQREAFSGNIGLVNHPAEKTSLTLNVGRAFRMPNAAEMFTKTISCVGIKMGNPDLEPEYSLNFDLGYRGVFENLEFDAALFTNLLDDFITQYKAPDSVDYDLTYGNISKARISGGELSASYRFRNLPNSRHHIMISGSAQYNYGVDVTGKDSYFTSGGPLRGIPPLRLRTALRYIGTSHFLGYRCGYFVGIDVDHFEAQNRIPTVFYSWGSEASEAYTLMGLTAGLNLKQLPGSPQFRLRVKNLMDAKYKPFGSYIMGMGRNIKILVRFSF